MKLHFMEALLERGLVYNVNDYWRSIHAQEMWNGVGVEKAITDFLALPEPPTAIFCWDSRLQNQLLTVLERKRMKVPRDVSLISSGYLDEKEASFSGFVMPHRELGRSLLKNLIATIRNPYHCIQELLEPIFVDRGDSRPSRRH